MNDLSIPDIGRRNASFSYVGDGESRKLVMSISSEDPTLRYDEETGIEYIEVLSHNPEDIDQKRLKKGLPILFDHETSKPLGIAKGYVIEEGKCFLKDITRCENTLARETWPDVESGALPFTSVGYKRLQGKVVGKKNGVPVVLFKWMPYEGSVVPVAEDVEVGTKMRALNETPSYLKIAFLTKNAVDLSPVSGNKPDMPEADIAAKQAELDKAQADLAASQAEVNRLTQELNANQQKALADAEQAKKDGAAEALRAESERQAALQKRGAELSAVHGKDLSKAIVEHISGGKSVADFNAWFADNGFKAAPLSNGSGDMDKKSMKRHDFNQLSPRDQGSFITSGGKLTD